MTIPARGASVARLLLAFRFVMAGAFKFADLGGTAGYIASKGLPLPQLLAFATATLEVVGGLAIVAGFQAGIAALALAVFTLVASFLFQNFWAVPADQQMLQQLMFMKNLAAAGGLLFVFAIGAGAASLDSRRASLA